MGGAVLPGTGENHDLVCAQPYQCLHQFVDVLPDTRALAEGRTVINEDAHWLLRLSPKSFHVNSWTEFNTLCYREPPRLPEREPGGSG